MLVDDRTRQVHLLLAELLRVGKLHRSAMSA
jgi:hypothetical protein